jgi:hypothetical protein
MTMAKLNTKPNIAAPDDFYADLLATMRACPRRRATRSTPG